MGQVDLVYKPAGGRVWLSAGRGQLKSKAASSFDRDLTWGVAEVVWELGEFLDALDPLYVAGRFSTIGTFDSNEGYKFELLGSVDDLGYNIKRADVFSAAIGIPLSDRVTGKFEYSWLDLELVNGVPNSIRTASNDRDYFGFGIAIGF